VVPRRSKLDIIRDILAVLEEKGPQPISRLATYANLPYDRLRRLIGELEEKRIVALTRSSSTLIVEITPQGVKLLEELRKLEALLRDLGLLQ
jgi:predicted transcriptional regulator